MNHHLIAELLRDCAILLNRALKGQTIACFGADGLGKYGRSEMAQHYVVEEVHVELYENADTTFPDGAALIFLEGYDAGRFGHLVTDQNFKLSVNALLQQHHISIACWDWAPARDQLNHAVVVTLDVEKLLKSD